MYGYSLVGKSTMNGSVSRLDRAGLALLGVWAVLALRRRLEAVLRVGAAARLSAAARPRPRPAARSRRLEVALALRPTRHSLDGPATITKPRC